MWFLGAAAARSAVNRQVAGSIPAGTASHKIKKNNNISLALIVEWYNRSLPTIWPGFDSRSTHPLIFLFFSYEIFILFNNTNKNNILSFKLLYIYVLIEISVTYLNYYFKQR